MQIWLRFVKARYRGMARKLKTFTTSAGFFDLAVAAPSMKAAVEAWGADENLFRRGFAKVSDDPDIVAAALKKPGVVLRRPVGSTDAYSENPALPESLPARKTARPAKRKAQKVGQQPLSVGEGSDLPREAAAKASSGQAALAFEREEGRRRREEKKEQRALEAERRRRARAIAAAQATLDRASRSHDHRLAAIKKARATVERRERAEKDRWRKERRDLESVLKRTRE